MKNLIFLCLFFSSSLKANQNFGDFREHLDFKNFENEMYMKVSTNEKDYFFYKGKSIAYREVIDHISSNTNK